MSKYRIGKLVADGADAVIEIFREGEDESVGAVIMQQGKVVSVPMITELVRNSEEAYLEASGEAIAEMTKYCKSLPPLLLERLAEQEGEE